MRLAATTVALAALMLSCKKDRVCECTTQWEGAPDKDVRTIVMKDVGYKTAMYACVHKKEIYTTPDTTMTLDIYCQLK